MNSFVAIDFETANQHRSSVCSVGLVVVEDREITNKYYSLIKPIPDYYSYWNTEVHGLTSWDTKDALYFPEVWTEMVEIIQDLPLVAHNSAFDEGCLKAVLAAYELPMYKNSFYCTCRTARKVFPELINHKLGTVSKYVGFDLTNHHNALADAEACAHIALEVF